MTWAAVGVALTSVLGTTGTAALGTAGAGALGTAGAGALGAGAAGAAGAGAAGALGSGALAGTAAGTIGAGGAAGALGSTATGALGSSLSAGSVLGSGSLGATGSSILGPGAGGALASGGGKAALGGSYGGLLQPMSGGTNLQGAELLQGQVMMMPESLQGSTYLSGEPGSTWSALDGESSWMPSNDTMQKALLASQIYGALKPKQQQKQQRPYPSISSPRFAGAPQAISRRSPIQSGGLLGGGRLGSRRY